MRQLKTAKWFVIAALGLLAIPAATSAGKPVHKLAPSYQTVYCYPGGTYWAKQISLYPGYYSKYNDYYITQYGAATAYCPS